MHRIPFYWLALVFDFHLCFKPLFLGCSRLAYVFDLRQPFVPSLSPLAFAWVRSTCNQKLSLTGRYKCTSVSVYFDVCPKKMFLMFESCSTSLQIKLESCSRFIPLRWSAFSRRNISFLRMRVRLNIYLSFRLYIYPSVRL